MWYNSLDISFVVFLLGAISRVSVVFEFVLRGNRYTSKRASGTFEPFAELMECIICGRTYKSYTALAHHQRLRHGASGGGVMRRCDQCDLQIPILHWRGHTFTEYHEAKKRRESFTKYAPFDVLD